MLCQTNFGFPIHCYRDCYGLPMNRIFWAHCHSFSYMGHAHAKCILYIYICFCVAIERYAYDIYVHNKHTVNVCVLCGRIQRHRTCSEI